MIPLKKLNDMHLPRTSKTCVSHTSQKISQRLVSLKKYGISEKLIFLKKNLCLQKKLISHKNRYLSKSWYHWKSWYVSKVWKLFKNLISLKKLISLRNWYFLEIDASQKLISKRNSLRVRDWRLEGKLIYEGLWVVDVGEFL